MRFALFLLVVLLPPPPAMAGDAPDHPFVAAMAQHLMVAELGDLARASFGPAEIHPQPGGGYWAVVGAFQSKAVTGRMTRHWYVAAVRQVCPHFRKARC